MANIAVVMPSMRPLLARSVSIDLIEAGRNHNLSVYVVEDGPEPTFNLPKSVKHFCWADYTKLMGNDAWIFPHHTDSGRSFGFYQAWKDGADVIISLDDDCLISDTYFDEHIKGLRPRPYKAWVNTIKGIPARGLPYGSIDKEQEIVMNHGLWSNVPDLDGATQLSWERANKPPFGPIDQYLPAGVYAPLSGMNIAFDRRMTPVMWFGLLNDGVNHFRMGDIAAGVIAKRICDHFGWGIHSGNPIVKHTRASNAWVNMEREAKTLKTFEEFWNAIDDIGPLHADTVVECYREITDMLPFENDYWHDAKFAMHLWTRLFE